MNRSILLAFTAACCSALAQPPEPAPRPDPSPQPEPDPQSANETLVAPPQQPPPREASTRQPTATPPATASLDNLAGSIEAKEAFGSMVETIRGAKTLTFHSRTTVTGFLAGHSANTDASVRLRRLPDRAGAWQLRVLGSGSLKGAEQPTTIDVVWGPAGATWLDHDKKTFNERPVVQSTGPLVKMAVDSVPNPLMERNAFSKEFNAMVVTLDSIETIDGVECSVLTFKPRTGSSTSRIWVGNSDHLPRKFERSSELKSYASTTTIECADMRINEPLGDEDFKIEQPDGFEREVVWSSANLNSRRAAPPQPKEAAAPDQTAAPSPEQARPRPAPVAPAVPPAPAFELTTPAGDRVSLAKLKGSVVVLYFWGTWSLPGRAGIDELQKLHEELSDSKVRALAIAVRERSKDSPIDFFKSGSRTVTLLLEGDKTAADYGVVVYPTFVVLDRAGVKVGTIEGFKPNATPEDIRTLITKAQSAPVTSVDDEPPVGGQ